MPMIPNPIPLVPGLVCLLAMATANLPAHGAEPPAAERSAPNAVLRPEDMADALHDVVNANRSIYTRLVVHRLQNVEKVIGVGDNWEKDKTLINPCEQLRLAAEAIQTKGAEFSYTLRGLAPIVRRNSPQTEVERLGLEAVARHPETNYFARETLGGRRYLTAVYADKAISPACVQCHNGHPQSPKKDWRPGDTMGALVVRVPLEF
jgi:hypothetical protein